MEIGQFLYMKYKLIGASKLINTIKSVIKLSEALCKNISAITNAVGNAAIIVNINRYGLCSSVNIFPSLLAKVRAFINLVSLNIFNMKGIPIIVSQKKNTDQNDIVLLLPALKLEARLNPKLIPNQNIRFHNLSLLSQASSVWLSCAKRALVALLLTAICVVMSRGFLLSSASKRALASLRAVRVIKSCIITFSSFISGYGYIVPEMYRSAKQIMITLSVIILLVWADSSYAATKAEILKMINDAEREYNIPSGLLTAIAKIESNLEKYAVNLNGRSILFKDKDEALKAIRQSIDAGITNIDIGIAQVNYRWHQQNFSNLEDMLLPRSNIQYAAKLLATLKREYGDWHTAIRRYHSANPYYHKKYSRKIVLCWLNGNKLTN